MEKVLSIPQPERIPQETGFWCGPASCQTALQILDQWVEEQQLANEMGTTENGTNSIDLLEGCLNSHAHNAQWKAVWLPNDPPTADQKETFWKHLKASIDAGFAVPGNWVAPPGNHPVAVLDSGPNPGYSGTIYHYICYVGYKEVDGKRYVRVADSGFAPWQYWVTLDQCITLMPPKGYVWASAAPVGSQSTPAAPGPTDAELLSYAMDESLSLQEYEQLLPHVRSSLEACECNTVDRVAMWLAQVGHESMGLKYFEELADGSAYEGRADLGNTEPGYGVKYKGRGAIMVTGFFNYDAVSKWAAEKGYVKSPTAFVDNPEALGTWEYGFQSCNWYWTVARGTQINEAADRCDVEQATLLINGGYNGLDDRKARYARAREVASAFLPGTQPSGPSQTEGDDFLSALSADEQKEMLMLLRILADVRFPSRSPFRHVGEGPVDTVAGMTLNTDASSHIQLVIRLAELGDTGAIDLLNEVAACTEADRQGDAKLAQRVLSALSVDHRQDRTPYDPRPAAPNNAIPAAPPRAAWRL